MSTYEQTAEMVAQRKREAQQQEFDALFAPIPTVPKVYPAEQREMAIDGTLEARYWAWRSTEDGRAVYAAIVAEARREVDAGTRRISSKGLVEWARRTLRIQINNSFTAHIARELHDNEPELRSALELRQRSAA